MISSFDVLMIDRQQTYVLLPNCYQHHFARRQNCLDGKDHQEDPIARSPLFLARDRLKRHGERICWLRSRYSIPRYVRVGDHWCPCKDHPAQCRVHQIQPPRTWHLNKEEKDRIRIRGSTSGKAKSIPTNLVTTL